MNFLQIALTNKCNLRCQHCPMGKWRNSAPPNFPLNNGELIPFLEKYVRPKEWIIELTGGEPALYEGIEELCGWLSTHSYKVLIKTNGMLPIPSFPNIKRVAAFHQTDCLPKFYDEILIVDKIDREIKEAYCKTHDIPYKIIGYNKEIIDDIKHEFVMCAFINPAGHQIGCAARRPIENVKKDGVDYNRITHRPLVSTKCCERCKAAHDAWIFL